jgi:hypothetical protein
MGVQDNMEDFAKCAGVVLNLLYDAFPVPTKLDSNNLQSPEEKKRLRIYADHPTGRVDNDPKIEQSLNVYRWTIQFLIHEGFIRDTHEERMDKVQRYTGSGQLGAASARIFPAVVLTAKGLAILDKVPDVIKGQPLSLIKRLKKALASPSKEAVNETIKTIISHSVPLLISNAPHLISGARNMF